MSASYFEPALHLNALLTENIGWLLERVRSALSSRSGLHASVSGGLPAVDMQSFAGDKCGVFEIEDPVDDIADLSDPADGARPGPRRTRDRALGS